MATAIQQIPIPSTGLPAELRALPDGTLLAAYLTGFSAAERALGSEELALEALNSAFVRLCGPSRWNPERGTLVSWFLFLIGSECKKLRQALGPKRAAKLEARAERFYREQTEAVPTAEQQMIAWEESELEAAELIGKRALCRRIYAAVYGNDDAVALLRHWATCNRRMQLCEIAFELGMTPERLYAAKKVIERALRKENDK